MSLHVHTPAFRRLTLIIISVVVTVGLGVPASAAGVLEPPPPYQPQVSCDPVAKPGVVAFRDLVLRKFGGRDLGIARDCAAGASSEHKEGRAWDQGLDWSDTEDRARAGATVRWLTETVQEDPGHSAKRLGVMYMIWNKEIWSAYRAEDGWRPYTGSSPHRDHIHFSFTWNGAMKRSSWWTGEVMPLDHGPCARWVGELAPRWRAPRLRPCPVPIQRPVADARGFYVAQSGETVRRVARFFSITRAQVRSWNDLPAPGVAAIPVGQRLLVVAPTLL